MNACAFEAALVLQWPSGPRTLVASGQYAGMLAAEADVERWRSCMAAVHRIQVLVVYVRQLQRIVQKRSPGKSGHRFVTEG